MAESFNPPCLMVLTGPRAGTRYAIEDASEEVLIGSDPSCQMMVDVPGVAPVHARLWVGADAVTVHEADAPGSLYLNDDPVSGQARLQNGDILWLGRPGDPDAVMLQCVLPARPGPMDPALLVEDPAPAPVALPADDEDSTTTLAFKPRSALSGVGHSAEDLLPDSLPDPMLDPGLDPSLDPPAEAEVEADPMDVTAALPGLEPPPPGPAPSQDEWGMEVTHDVSEAEPPSGEQAAEIIPDEEPLAVEPTVELRPGDGEPVVEAMDATVGLPPPPPPPEAESVFDYQPEPDVTMDLRPRPVEAAVEAEPPPAPFEPQEDASTLIIQSYEATVADLPLPPPPVKPPVREEPPPRFHEFEEDIVEPSREPATLVHLTQPEPTLAQAPGVVPVPEEVGETVAIPPPPPPAPREPPRPMPPVGPPPRVASARPPEPPSRSAAPSARPAPRSSAVVPRPPAGRPAEPAAKGASAKPKSSSSGGLYAAVGGLVLLAVLAGGAGLWYWRTQQATAPAVSPPPPTQAAQVPAPVSPEAPAPPSPEVSIAAVEPSPEVPAVPSPVEEVVTIVRSPSPTPSGRPSPSPARPSPAVAQATRPPTAAPPTGPAPEVVRAQQVAGHLSQAQAAMNAKDYDTALAQYEASLKLDPQNAAAQAGRTAATAARNVSRKKFVAGRTVVRGSGKSGGSITGFESADVSVQKAPDFTGRIEFEMAPPAVKPGEGYRLRVYLVNEGKKSIKISGMSVTTLLNGARGVGSTSPQIKEVDPQQRALLDEVAGQWPAEVTAWSAEAQVNAGRGESLRNQLTWR